MNDPYGYVRLERALVFLGAELASLGETELANSLGRALAFANGSPSEYLDESLSALDEVRANRDRLPDSLAAFADGLAREIRRGFAAVGDL